MNRGVRKDILFFIGVELLFFSTPLYMTYLPNLENMTVYFQKTAGLRGPFLTIPLWLFEMGMEMSIVCRIYIFMMNLLTCVLAWYALARISGNAYAGLAGSLCYNLSIYSMFIRYDRGALGEITAFSFVPLVLYGMWKLLKGRGKGLVLVIGLLGILCSSIPVSVITYGAACIIFLLTCKKMKQGGSLPWCLTALALPLLAASPILLSWGKLSGGWKGVWKDMAEFLCSYRIRLVVAAAVSVMVSLVGRYIYSRRAQMRILFLAAVAACNLCGGIYYMNDLLYSTERSETVAVESESENETIYMNR